MTNYKDLENFLICPETGSELKYNEKTQCFYNKDKKTFPIRNHIVDFVELDDYSESFGMQWNIFNKTQLDSHTGHKITHDRFWNATSWNPDEIKDKWVLDLGCGQGRFAEIALEAGAKVIAVDYSSSVDAAYLNLSRFNNLFILKADINNLPLKRNSFEYVYSIGVIQHTPNVKETFFSVADMVRPGGKICVDVYYKRLRTMMHGKYLLRPFTKKMERERLLSLISKLMPTALKISQLFGSIPLLGKILKRLIPIADYTGIYPLRKDELLNWAILDTFDMLSPAYDNPQTSKTFKKWFIEKSFINIEVLHIHHLVGRAQKPVE